MRAKSRPWRAFALHYVSSRTQGRKGAYTVHVVVSGETIPPDLQRIELTVSIAGQRFRQMFDPLPDQTTTFTWDGRDAFGRLWQGQADARIELDYVYPARYSEPFPGGFPEGASVTWASPGGPVEVVLARQDMRLRKTWWSGVGSIDQRGPWDALGQGLGGWSLGVHHTYDPVAGRLIRGDGSERNVDTIASALVRVAGTGAYGFAGEGGPATEALLGQPQGIAVAADGSIFIADAENSRVRRISPAGLITTVAGDGTYDSTGDGGPAVSASLARPVAVATTPEGSLLIADRDARRVRRVDPSGIISTVAGNGDFGDSGDGGLATDAALDFIEGLAAGPDGVFCVSSPFKHRVRCVRPDGIILTVAGTHVAGFSGDGGLAVSAMLSFPTGLALATDGGLLIADRENHRVRRVSPDGAIATVAGTGAPGVAGDGGPATAAELSLPHSVAVRSDSGFCISDAGNQRVRCVAPDGIITTVAGNGAVGLSGENGPAPRARLFEPRGLAVDQEGRVIFADSLNHQVRRVEQVLPAYAPDDFLIASEDGSQLYVFDRTNRHLRTLDARTGVAVLTFHYDDPDGRLLTAVEDGDGNVTTILRDGTGAPLAIEAPGGQTTTLGRDATGYLDSLINPAGDEWEFVYTSDGLLTREETPRDLSHEFTHDPLGMLVRDEDPAGGTQTFVREDVEGGHVVTRTTTAGRES
jgi:YD repeat-containing protein